MPDPVGKDREDQEGSLNGQHGRLLDSIRHKPKTNLDRLNSPVEYILEAPIHRISYNLQKLNSLSLHDPIGLLIAAILSQRVKLLWRLLKLHPLLVIRWQERKDLVLEQADSSLQ